MEEQPSGVLIWTKRFNICAHSVKTDFGLKDLKRQFGMSTGHFPSMGLIFYINPAYKDTSSLLCLLEFNWNIHLKLDNLFIVDNIINMIMYTETIFDSGSINVGFHSDFDNLRYYPTIFIWVKMQISTFLAYVELNILIIIAGSYGKKKEWVEKKDGV
jgi:hypothetical protein